MQFQASYSESAVSEPELTTCPGFVNKNVKKKNLIEPGKKSC